MDTASWLTMTNGLLLTAGIVIGVLAGHFFSPALREAKRLQSELETLQAEHDKYRSSVNSHFRKTADLVGQMTKSYAAVYDHLAGGARRFCDEAGADSQLPFGPSPGQLASPIIEAEAQSEAAADDAGPEADGGATYEADDASTTGAEESAASGEDADPGKYSAAESSGDVDGTDRDADELANEEVNEEVNEEFPRTPTV